jgi:hypothetical protein
MRQILHHGPTPGGTPVILDDRAISGCWFELHRQGGCGAGEVVLQRDFHERRAIEIGDWISFETAPGQRVYLGRVEECRYQVPGLLRLRLMGMSIELNEIFPGGFGASPPEQRPHRYGATDLFSNDPDRPWEVAYPATTLQELVRLLLTHHVLNQTPIQYIPSRVESPRVPTKALSVKFRGEESIRSILKDLAMRAQANWGVDAQGQFFFIRRRTSLLSTLQLGRDLLSWEELRDRELLFNRLLLTGDYIYDKRDQSAQIARRVYRWRANYFEPTSCQRHGNCRLRLWVPWIRTQADSLSFAREFFRQYAEPSPRFFVETIPGQPILLPWEGEVGLEDSQGAMIGRGIVDKVRVQFDHAPRMRLEIGPEDPREQWPEPPQDERWELPDHIPSNGGDVSVTDQSSGGGGGGGSSSEQNSTQPPVTSSDHSSEDSSSQSSDGSSEDSSDGSDHSSVSWPPTTDSTAVSWSSTEDSQLSSEASSSGTSGSEADSSDVETSAPSSQQSSEQTSESGTSSPSSDHSSGVASSDQSSLLSSDLSTSESDESIHSSGLSSDESESESDSHSIADSSSAADSTVSQTDSSAQTSGSPSSGSDSDPSIDSTSRSNGVTSDPLTDSSSVTDSTQSLQISSDSWSGTTDPPSEEVGSSQFSTGSSLISSDTDWISTDLSSDRSFSG